MNQSSDSFVLLLCSYHVLLVAKLLRILLRLLVYHTCQFECAQADSNLFPILLEIKRLWVEVRSDSYLGWMCRKGEARDCWDGWPEALMHNMFSPSPGLGFGDCQEVGVAQSKTP